MNVCDLVRHVLSSRMFGPFTFFAASKCAKFVPVDASSWLEADPTADETKWANFMAFKRWYDNEGLPETCGPFVFDSAAIDITLACGQVRTGFAPRVSAVAAELKPKKCDMSHSDRFSSIPCSRMLPNQAVWLCGPLLINHPLLELSHMHSQDFVGGATYVSDFTVNYP